MPYIDEEVFSEQMRGLLVARGGYTSEKKKEELKRYWYLEFRSCDERAFIRVMQDLKFGGDGGFPTFRDFRDLYRVIMPESLVETSREYCGLCTGGRVFFRDINKSSGDVQDYVGSCARCASGRYKEMAEVNPHNLHKDRLGYFRTFEALKVDRETGGLHPQNDPDIEINLQPIEPEPPKLANGKDIARAMFGAPDPKEEKIREESKKRASDLPDVPY